MSNAARKARKREQREAGQKYQHPTREGVPYGTSKPPSPARWEDPEFVVADLLAAAEWPRSW